MRADLALRAEAPVPAVEPPNAVEPRAAKAPMTRTTSATRAYRDALPAPFSTRRLPVNCCLLERDFLGFPAKAGTQATPADVRISSQLAPVAVARARMVVREPSAPRAEQALAERLLLVTVTERVALFQDRQDVLDEVRRRARLDQRRDQEPVEIGTLGEPAELVGDVLGRTDDGVGADAMAMPRADHVADGLALEALDLRLAHLRVQLFHRGGRVVGREVETREPGVGRERDLRCLRREDLLVLALCRFARRRDDDRDTGKRLDRLRIAPDLHRLLPHGSRIAAQLLGGRAGDEDAFPVRRAETAAATGAPRLEEDRRSLRRRGRVAPPVRLEVRPVVVDAVHLFRHREDARLVPHQSVRFPAAFPELVDDLHEVVGHVV